MRDRYSNNFWLEAIPVTSAIIIALLFVIFGIPIIIDMVYHA